MPVFLNPWLLFGLAAAGIPIALHLLNRRNPRPIPFSTIRFLQEAIAETRRIMYLTQILLLLLRVLILVLLALAFAQPRIRASRWLPDGPRTAILVVDRTASMGAGSEAGGNFAAARDWAVATLGQLGERDKAALVTVGSGTSFDVFPAIQQFSRVEQALKQLTPGSGTTDMVSALRLIAREAVAQHRNESLEIHLFSDCQESNWPRTEVRDLGVQLKEHDIHLFVNRLPLPQTGNAGLLEAACFPDALVGTGEVLVRADVVTDPHFSGPNVLAAEVDGEEKARRGLSLQPTQRHSVTVGMEVGGDRDVATGVLRLDHDAFEADNTYYFALARRQPLHALVLEGGEAPEAQYADGFYLRHALNPQGLAEPLIRTETKPFTALAGLQLDGYDAVFVTNPPPFDATAALKLELYAQQGGTLVLYPGDRGGLDTGLRLFKPLSNISVSRDSSPTTRTFRLLHSMMPHALEKKSARVFRRLPGLRGSSRLSLGLTGPRSVFYNFETGTPFFVRVTAESGAIWVAAVPADRSWSEWPLSPLFVFFHQELVKAQGAERRRVSQVAVGSTTEFGWSGPELSLEAQVKGPAGATHRVVLERSSARRGFALDTFDAPGVYQVQLPGGDSGRRLVAVNLPPVELALAAVDARAFPTQLAPASVLVSNSVAEHQAAMGSLAHGTPVWPALLLLAFLLAVVEELFANVRSRQQSAPSGMADVLRGAAG